MTTFIRLLEFPVDAKAAGLRDLVASIASGSEPISARKHVFERDPRAFGQVPGSPFAYWVSDTVRSAFAMHPSFDKTCVAVRGAYTTDDFRYYRLAWEVGQGLLARTRAETLEGLCYVPLAKGGSFSRYYADVHLAIRWRGDGAEAKAFLSAYRERKGWGTDWSACLNGYGHYFRAGLTWPRRTTSGLGLRVMPAGCIFADKGPAAFVEANAQTQILALCAVLNSSAFGYLVSVQLAAADAAARSYEVGLIQRTPVPVLREVDVDFLARLARRAWSLKRQLDTTNEASHAFLLPSGLNETVTGLDAATVERELAAVQRQIDDRAFDLYDIGPRDRSVIETSAPDTSSAAGTADELGEKSAEDDEGEDDRAPVGAPADTLLSWLVGVAFGRFDERLATGKRPVPPEPEPFDPLPERSPGMWPADEERSVLPRDVMVDDPGHNDDIRGHVASAAARTGWPDPGDLRQWLAREFFPLHIKMYSKSRRKAPIYWQLATPSASYSVWLYIHAFTKDTLYKVQNDYVAPKLRLEERKLDELRASKAPARELSTQETFVEELRAFRDEVVRVAPLWNPDLDDGVIINFAPLWRLVPQHRPWQKECLACWEKLCAGEYDWAHLAMHLWPERVVPKCKTDRSLAIAHDLEDVFWEELDGKWKPRATPTRDIDSIVRERTSAAVKDALDSLLRAGSAPASSTGRRPRKRAAK